MAWLQPSTRKPQWFQYFKLVFVGIPIVKTWSVFQNQVICGLEVMLLNIHKFIASYVATI